MTRPTNSSYEVNILVKIPCEICNIQGTLQKVGNNYYRIRHYEGSFNKKLRFHYHQNTKQYALQELEKLREHNMLVNTIFDQNPKNTKTTIDPKEHKQHTKQQNMWASSSAWIEHHPPKVGVVVSKQNVTSL